MAQDIEDNRGALGREQSGGSAAKQNPARGDSDRGYGARDGQREQGGADRGDKAPAESDTPSQYTGIGGARTDVFGGRADQPGSAAEGWHEIGIADDQERLGGEDEQPG